MSNSCCCSAADSHTAQTPPSAGPHPFKKGRGEPETAACPLEIHCPVEATLRLVGGKHKALILWKLIPGAMRFSELRRAVPAATPKMLTQQLRELEEDGLVHREIFPVIPPRVEYSLTAFGQTIRPVLESMYAWGTGYLEHRGLKACCSMEPLP